MIYDLRDIMKQEVVKLWYIDMMPHPEGATNKELSNTDGKLIFESILN
jgi:phosphoribosylformylglycinamidine (FGAM) synthase-like amidotransferase family enzyme